MVQGFFKLYFTPFPNGNPGYPTNPSNPSDSDLD